MVLDLFSGIGGISVGLEAAGMQTVAFCEQDPYCRSVLAKHWPEVEQHGDIRRLDALSFRGRVDMVAGGPPCQAASVAGKRLGHEDDRWLWGEYLRVIRDVRPEWLLAENVPGLVSLRPLGLDWILDELEAEGYSCETVIVGAEDVGAPHLRKRVWIVAHAADRRREGRPPASEEGRSSDTRGDTGELPGRPGGLRRSELADPERDALRLVEQRVSGGRAGGVRDEGQAVAGGSGEVDNAVRSGRALSPEADTRGGKRGEGKRLRNTARYPSHAREEMGNAPGDDERRGGEGSRRQPGAAGGPGPREMADAPGGGRGVLGDACGEGRCRHANGRDEMADPASGRRGASLGVHLTTGGQPDAARGGSLAHSDGGRCGVGGESKPRRVCGARRDEPDGCRCGRTGAPRWPAGRFQRQHEWEPPRVLPKPEAALGWLGFGEDELGVLEDGSLLNPDWVEVLMGYEVGHTKTHCSTRNDRLRALGNSVVPQVVEAIGYAIRSVP